MRMQLGKTPTPRRAARMRRTEVGAPAQSHHPPCSDAAGIRASIAQVVAGVAVRVLLEILLMLFLGGPELAGGDDLGDDGRRPLTRLVDARLHLLGGLPLRIGVIE